MSDVVAHMTKAEFSELIETIVEQKLLELLGDADEGLELRELLRRRLEKQRRDVAAGERGRTLDDIVSEMASE